jgi:2-C-methyl-D-erythritol 4-phosphate cytidylyltransferase
MNLLDTGKTYVLLNGAPIRWINCRNGLQQGDPLSPYLFIIVVDVLRCLLQHPSISSSLKHPLIPDAPCPILQYVDDTLIFLRCSMEDVLETKHVLEIFENATGQSIN